LIYFGNCFIIDVFSSILYTIDRDIPSRPDGGCRAAAKKEVFYSPPPEGNRIKNNFIPGHRSHVFLKMSVHQALSEGNGNLNRKGTFMTTQTARKPLANFFVKKALQIRLIVKIVIAVIVATVISSGTLLLVYYMTYKNLLLYQMDRLANLTKESIVFIILPSLLISALVNFLMAVGIGLYASRKYAVPVYKLENWARLLKDGRITAKIQFREKEELRELADQCNMLSADLLKKLTEIKKHTDTLSETGKDGEALKKTREILSTFDLDASTIEIHTSCYTIAKPGA
jgi:hypothetical protein